MKEKVFGALMMFVIAVVVLTSATFAWITLSSNPEAAHLDTTVAANGNLEIALVPNDGAYPTSGRGDSSAVDNDIARSNITWGNLVNLSDASYGIQNIALRPALLSENNLLISPLQGAVYGQDGRITTLDTDYTFAKWNGYEFIASTESGVRAITAYKLAVSDATATAVKNQIARQQQLVINANGVVNNQYKNNAITTANINGLKEFLSIMVSAKVTDKLNDMGGVTSHASETTPIPSDSLQNLYNLYNQILIAMEYQKSAYTELANFQRYINSLSTGTEYVPLDWDTISKNNAKYNVADPDKVSTDKVVNLPGLTQFITDIGKATTDVATFKEMYEDSRDNGTVYYYPSISSMCDRLLGTSGVTINGKPMSQIGASEALDMLDGAQICLKTGILARFEQYAIEAANRMNVTMSKINVDTSQVEASGFTVNMAKSMLSGGIKNAHVYTGASATSDGSFNANAGPSYTQTSLAKAASASIDLVPGDKVATDNYGLAIDLWVRTNTDETYLVLDGEVEKEVNTVVAMGTDDNGAPVELYVAKVFLEEGVTTSVDVYQKNGNWYRNGSASIVNPDDIDGAPVVKMEEVTTITGYHGSNRVWDEDDKPLITADSTTQGNGSCFIFYADSAEDQERFLKLLEAFRVAFVNSSGSLMTTGVLDIENLYAVNGKVTVPLKINSPLIIEKEIEIVDDEGNPVLDEEGQPTYDIGRVPLTDSTGEYVYAITELKRNTAVKITAIVYLDGTLIGNDDVLASSSIQGQLNLQFASTEKLHPAGDVELENQERTIVATVDKTSLEYGEDELKVRVSVSVDGDSPANVSAFFQRAINSTQGKRMETRAFTASGENSWVCDFTFIAPGEYYIREVMLDGVNYRLNTPVHVSITGFAPEYVNWGEADNTAVVYTASNSYPENVYISFGADDSIVGTTKVVLQFKNEDNGNFVDVKMSYDPIRMHWAGTANFGMSGNYSLQYVKVNGEQYDLAEFNESFVKRLTLYLGLSAYVTSSSSQRDFYTGEALYKDMKVTVYDNSGNELQNLEGALLTYSRGSSTTELVTTELSWNANSEKYTGTLQITRPGNYQFNNITVGSHKITYASSSPTFYVKNPDPVSYNAASVSTYHGDDNIQFVPLANNAFIGPIRIANSDTAYISAVVRNSITGEDYTITQSSDNTRQGTMYYDAGSWYINLPTYRVELDDETYSAPIQDGTWTVKSISLWDVIDTNNVEHTISNKLVWADGVDGYDFGPLSTIVSSTVNVDMTLTGSTNLGDGSTPFMTAHSIAGETGMAVTIRDDAGRAIPENKIASVMLNLSYTDNTDRSYGYKVRGYNRQPSVVLSHYTGNNGIWDASEDLKVQYVGEYVVKNLTVTMPDNSTIVINPNEHGVPTTFSVRSAGPENNVKYSVKQGKTVYGKNDSNVVTGSFLEGYNPDIMVTARVTYINEAGVEAYAQYALLDDLAVKLQFRYKNGKTAPNGGYSWSGTSLYESIDMTLTPGENTSNGIPYTSGVTPMLAGSYGVTGTIAINGTQVPLDFNFSDISVYSVSPTLKVTAVSPAPTTLLHIFIPSKSTGTYEDYVWDESNLAEVKNFKSDYMANVYMGVEEDNGHPAYTAPQVTLGLSSIGTNFESASASVSGASSSGAATFSFTPSSNTSKQSIGYSESKTETLQEGGTCGSDSTVTYDIPHFAGTKTISAVSVVSGGITYSVNLTNTVTIRESNEVPPTLSFIAASGYNQLQMPDSQISEDGQAFDYVLPTSAGTQTKRVDEITENADPVQTGTQTNKYSYISGSTDKTRKTSGCNATTYYYCEFTFKNYTRTVTTYEVTGGTNTYDVVYGVTGWIVDGVTYAPGATVHVTGQMTATPVIGELSRTLVSQDVKTTKYTKTQDSLDSTTTANGSETTSSASAARTLYPSAPSGYSYYNNSNKTDGSWVSTTAEWSPSNPFNQ